MKNMRARWFSSSIRFKFTVIMLLISYNQRLTVAASNEAYVSDEVEDFEVESSTSQDIIVLVTGDEQHDDGEFETNA
jgi:hypothetical protein